MKNIYITKVFLFKLWKKNWINKFKRFFSFRRVFTSSNCLNNFTNNSCSKVIGFIKNIREDGKIDVSLQPMGYRNTIHGDKEKIITHLIKNGGILNLTDKSSPEAIKFHLQMSKKAFKRALGSLYKEKKVLLFPNKIQKK